MLYEDIVTTFSLNIHFRKSLTLHEIAQIVKELDERLKDFDIVLRNLFEDDYDCMTVSIKKEEEADAQ